MWSISEPSTTNDQDRAAKQSNSLRDRALANTHALYDRSWKTILNSIRVCPSHVNEPYVGLGLKFEDTVALVLHHGSSILPQTWSSCWRDNFGRSSPIGSEGFFDSKLNYSKLIAKYSPSRKNKLIPSYGTVKRRQSSTTWATSGPNNEESR